MNERQIVEQFRLTPEGQKLLKTIRFAEGTAGPQGYRTKFGGGLFKDFSRHPNEVVKSGGYASAAAGAYQFLPGTFASQQKRLNLPDFGPVSQDLAALILAREKLMPLGGLAALKKEGFSPRVANALASTWASIPTLSGKSYYGQPVKSLSSLQNVFNSAVATAPTAQSPVGPTTADRPQEFNFKNKLSGILLKYLGSSTQQTDPLNSLIAANASADALEEAGTEEALIQADAIRNSALLKSLSSSPSDQYATLATDLVGLLQAKREAELGASSQPSSKTQPSVGGGNLKVIEYLTGDPKHPNFRADHGGSNYHEHLAFASPEQARAAARKLNAAGIKTTELKGVTPVGRHSERSHHYTGAAFDVPAAQVPVGQERALSQKVRQILGLG